MGTQLSEIEQYRKEEFQAEQSKEAYENAFAEWLKDNLDDKRKDYVNEHQEDFMDFCRAEFKEFCKEERD